MRNELDVWQREVDRKLDRILNDVDFIKNRTTTYLGRNEALTYLADETPIFVNTDDFGCPLNFINGGLYEEDYFRVFLSFRNPRLPMLDVGANLGVYSIRMAPYMRGMAIHAFEPIPRIRNLFSRSVFLNGHSGCVQIHPFAVSDVAGIATLAIPTEHAGGASLETLSDIGNGISVDMKRLDDFFPTDFSCGLVKLDVEGHELHALRGMQRILTRSNNAAVMFEKLSSNSGIEHDVHEFFLSLGWGIYGIEGRRLEGLDLAGFISRGGYFLAAPAAHVMRDGLDRDFFRIFPTDINVLEGNIEESSLRVDVTGMAGKVIFHGPYWWLPRGYYRLSIDGDLNQPVVIELCEKFGYKVFELRMEPGTRHLDFPVYRDLNKFELVMRPSNNSQFKMVMNHITITRLG